MNGFIQGILAYFKAIRFIGANGLSRYFIYSGLIGLVILALCSSLIWYVNPIITNWVQSNVPWQFDFLETLTSWISIGLSSLLFISIFKYLMLIFTAPVMSVLSEKVENKITGLNQERSVIYNIVPDLIRALRINLRNIIRELFFTVLLLLLGLIPVFAVISGIVILLVQAYYAGFGNYDFWAERHFSYRETIRYMKRRQPELAGNGIVFIFLLAIPVLGAFIAPPLATVASTMEASKEFALENL